MGSDKKRVQVKIEFGHQAISKEKPTDPLKTHDWTVFVKGVDGADISHIVEKVIFHLHSSFPKPKRIRKEPPYKLSESGYGSFNLPIEVYFKTHAKEDARKHLMQYDLSLQMLGLPPLNCTKIEALTFLNPSEEFEKRLLKAGAVILPALPEDVPKVKSVSPASSAGSPNPQKKTSATIPKIKKESQNSTTTSVKRSSEDALSSSKPKKKKSNDHERAPTPVNAGLKEISILSTATDAAAKSNSARKVKDGTRRRSVDANEPSPKHHSSKESKHKSKDSKLKKDKSLDLNSSSGGIPKLKFSIKSKSDGSWAATSVTSKENGNAPEDSNISNTVLVNPNSTVSQQNELVRNVLDGFRQQSSEDDINEEVEKSMNSSLSSNGSLETTSKSSSKKATSKHRSPSVTVKTNGTHHSSHHPSKGKVIKEPVETKTTSETGKKMPDPTLTQPELNEMFSKISESQDSNILQGIVDIVEATGDYMITSSTFDFDLCTLNNDTLVSIKQYLEAH